MVRQTTIARQSQCPKKPNHGAKFGGGQADYDVDLAGGLAKLNGSSGHPLGLSGNVRDKYSCAQVGQSYRVCPETQVKRMLSTTEVKESGLSVRAQSLCTLVLCTFVLSPPLMYGSAPRLIVAVAIAVWLAVEATRKHGVIRRPTRAVMCVVLYCVYTALMTSVWSGGGELGRNIQVYIMLLFLVMQQANRRDMRQMLPAFWLIVVLCIIWQTRTLYYLQAVDKRAMRVLVRSDAQSIALHNSGVGGYSMAYGAVLMIPAIVAILSRPKINELELIPARPGAARVIAKLGLWYLLASSIAVVAYSQFSLAVFAAGVALITSTVLRDIRATRVATACVLVAVLVLFGETIALHLLQGLIPLAEGTNYELKIGDLASSIQSSEAMGTAGERTERYIRSLELFLRSPLWGEIERADVGKHSQLLDSYAQWGLGIGALLTYLLIFNPALKTTLGCRGSWRNGFAVSAAVTALVVFGLNNAFMSAGAIVYLVYPVVYGTSGATEVEGD